MHLLEVKDLYKEFYVDGKRVRVLKGVNFYLDEGEFVSISGVSGVGKTTFLQIVGTIDRPTSGSILFKGKDLTSLSERELDVFRNQHMGFVFQFHYLIPEFTAVENVALPALIGGKSRREAYMKAQELLQFLGLGDRLNHRPGELSGGEQQRVAIARALVNSPDIVFADEPTGNLDLQTQERVFDVFLKAVREVGCSLLLVTHNEAIASRADRTFRMIDGLLVGN